MVTSMPDPEPCHDCGSTLLGQGAMGGLCPTCLLRLAEQGPDAGVEPLALPALRGPIGDHAFRPGRIVARRYRLVSQLGAGGMGEVWRAFDFKLRVEVALKRLRPDVLGRSDALNLLRREVRAARRIVSLNVCRVFDLVAEDEQELVSMEYIEGRTLAAMLAERSPLPLREAAEIAAQFLAGLEAIHQAGLAHRDVKPENIMVTSSRRVVLMDFGLARIATEWAAAPTGGTPAYMALEEAATHSLATTDVFAAGIVLGEMVFPDGVRSPDTRRRLWRALREDHSAFPDGPWRPIVLRAVARAPEARYASAGELARALEAIAIQSSPHTTTDPYPGLVPFTDANAEYFFGREFEVEVLLRELRRPRLRAVLGPSGAGKTSFVRAGLVPALPDGWSAIVCTPGDRPVGALSDALARWSHERSGTGDRPSEPDAALVDAVRRWRRRHTQAIVIVDQFEELFTLNPTGVQERVAGLLARLVLDADVHVLLCLRDDFLWRCHAHEALRPLFSAITPLAAPTGNALRRALVQPALRAGGRFEDDRLVDEILDAVAGERGALPLLAFAMARLWDRRDRATGVITRASYKAIEGVGGALAQHAETVLESLGQAHLPVVRELFRNLVTADGTRAVQDRHELLSTFRKREEAEAVLQRFIDARLLTSFERQAESGRPPGHRVEIIHESLLTEWPRLARWRVEDQDALRFRDQVRQAARLWDDRGRPADLLWIGTAFTEFEIWKERYGGGLTTTERAFARAMIEHVGRRRARRRRAAATTMALLVAIVAVIGKLWFDSRRAEGEARQAALHAEAQQLFALGQLELERNPSAALAFALASLERADTAAVRQFAVEALWRGPTALLLDDSPAWADSRLGFSPDGRWLAADREGGEVWLWPQEGGVARTLAGGRFAGFTGDSRYLVTTSEHETRVYDLPAGELVRAVAGGSGRSFVRGHRLITAAPVERPGLDGHTLLVRVQFLPDGVSRTLGTWTLPAIASRLDVDAAGRYLFAAIGGELHEIPLVEGESSRIRRLVRTPDPIFGFTLHPSGDRVFTWHASGAVQVWSRPEGILQRRLHAPPVIGTWRVTDISPDGRWLASANGNDQTVHLWDLEGPPDADPLVLRRGEVTAMLGLAFHPGGGWLVTQDYLAVSLWPLARAYASVLRGPADQLRGDVVFDPHGRWVAAGGQMERKVWVWPMKDGEPVRVLDAGVGVSTLDVSPAGDLLAAATRAGIRLIPVDGGPPRPLPGFEDLTVAIAFDRTGRRVAGGGGFSNRDEAMVRVWDLETGGVRVLDAGDGEGYGSVDFLPDGRLVTAAFGGLRLWDATFTYSTVLVDGVVPFARSRDGRHLLAGRGAGRLGVPVLQPFVYDVETGHQWDLATHGEVTLMTWDRAGTRVVTGSREGIVRVGPFTGEAPHLLVGHHGTVWGVDVDPSGRWIASAGEDRTVRVWPIPEGPPFHTLPHGELLQQLRSLTTYRVDTGATTPTGSRLTGLPLQSWHQAPPVW